MEFVVLLYVLAITLTQVIAVPIDTEDSLKTKDGQTDDAIKLKLPKPLEPNFKVKIEGKLNSGENKFTVVLPNNEIDENLHCTMNYNHTNNSMEVTPPFKKYNKTTEFLLFYEDDESKDTYFILELMAKEDSNCKEMAKNCKEMEKDYSDCKEMAKDCKEMGKDYSDGKMLEMMFTVKDVGSMFEPLHCSIKSFEDLSHIHFKKGVKSIDSILFTF